MHPDAGKIRKRDTKLGAEEVLRQTVLRVSSPGNPWEPSPVLCWVVKVKGAVFSSDKTFKTPESLRSSAQLDDFNELFLGFWLRGILI